MPTTTYIIRFAHRAPTTTAPYEEQEHTTSPPLGNPTGSSPSRTAPKCTPKSSWSSTATRKTPSGLSLGWNSAFESRSGLPD